MSTLDARLDAMAEEVRSDRFLSSRGLGNELAYYIFDYDPKDERPLRQGLATKLGYLQRLGLGVCHLDLFEIMLVILKQKRLYDRVLQLEPRKGSAYIWDALKKSVSADDLVKAILDEVETHQPAVVFLSGMGRIWPVARGHKVLNRLQERLDHCPVVIFFPGEYSGRELRLFGKFRDDNYYRAFQLVPRKEQG